MTDSPLDTATPVGFIGLGNMGAPIAERLLAWEGGLVVCDVRPQACQPFVDKGATAATTPAEVAATAHAISITVLDDAQVREVIFGDNGIMSTAKAGTIIAIHSTIAAGTAEEIASECAKSGVHVVDAPVSGGAPGAQKGELAVMVGANDEAYALIKPVFKLWSTMIVRAGEPGAGTQMKLARNLLNFVGFAAACEANRLAEAAGLDLEKLGRVVRHSDAITGGAGSIMLRDSTSALEEDNFWHSIFTHVRGLGEKDLSLAHQLGSSLGVSLPMTEIALASLGEGLGVGPGDIASSFTN